MRTFLCGLTLIAASATSVFAQDMTITSRVKNGTAQPTTSVSYLSKDHIRMAIGDGQETIIDVRSGQMTTIDTNKKTYSVLTQQNMDAFATRMQARMNSPEMKQAQEKMNKMPPADRAKMDQAMERMFSIKVQNTGVNRKIAGYDCQVWTVVSAFSKTEECMSTELQLPVSAWDAYRHFSERMKGMMASMGPMAKGVTKMQEQMKAMKGFPLSHSTSTDVMGQKSVVVSEVTSVSRGSIPDSVWAIPAGYKQVENPMLKAMSRKGGKDNDD